jgi:hypothetical protein
MLGHLVYHRTVYDAWQTQRAVRPPVLKNWVLRTVKTILRQR